MLQKSRCTIEWSQLCGFEIYNKKSKIYITSEKVFVLSSQKSNNFDICCGKAKKQKKTVI